MKYVLTSLLLFIVTHVNAEDNTPRIITIGGAITEIVYQLGHSNNIVASDTTSYYPAAAKALPKVGYQRALSAEGILSMNPELIMLTEEAGPATVLKQLQTAGVEILRLKSSRSFEDVLNAISQIGSRLGAESEAEQLVQELTAQKQKLDATLSANMTKKKIMFILQHGGGTPMVAGTNTAADSIIALAGASNSVTGYEGYKPLTPEAAITQAPDIILITEQGLQQAGGKQSLLKNPGLSLTPAGSKGHVIAMDSLLLLGFGPRTIDAARQLHEKFSAL